MNDRARLTERVRAAVQRHGWARLEMSVLVVFTGLAGFLLSAGLLKLGLTAMALRYPLAVLGAYVVFLGLVRVWVELHRRGVRLDPELFDLAPDSVGGDVSVGEGGDFGGGGASDAWDAPSPVEVPSSGVVDATPAGAGDAADGLDILDVDDLALLLIPVIVLIGGVAAAFLLIWSAPALLVEVLIDVLLSSALYRRLRSVERRYWLLSVLRRTGVPVAIGAALLTLAGVLIQVALPSAESIGDVLRSL